ncbi:hypothetical protein ACFYZJ_16795 [Streptomyces sp. NPDC001848]|uniref:hypothetical protein n=1 Tax=Streptomyces sp. NPDC001848 TaxID=3364618 RepID=UPI00368B6A6E
MRYAINYVAVEPDGNGLEVGTPDTKQAAMGCFPKLEDVPEMVVDFVRRAVELPEGTLPLYRAVKTAKNHRGLVRQRVGVVYDQAEARRDSPGHRNTKLPLFTAPQAEPYPHMSLALL